MSYDFKGRKLIVIGGTSGMGLETLAWSCSEAAPQ